MPPLGTLAVGNATLRRQEMITVDAPPNVIVNLVRA